MIESAPMAAAVLDAPYITPEALRHPHRKMEPSHTRRSDRPRKMGVGFTMTPTAIQNQLKSLPKDRLSSFVLENLNSLSEDEAVAVLDNPHITPKLCGVIAQTQRLAAFYSVRLRLVAHRQTPQAHAIKLVHYLYWLDLVRLSVEVTVPPTVRRAIDTVLLTRVEKLTLGEKIAAARRCSAALIKVFLFDRDPRVFASLLVNQRLREDDLLLIASSPQASVDQLVMLAGGRKWSSRHAVRKALVLNPLTPRSIAASQLRFLTRRDLRQIHDNPSTSVYLRRCIERLEPHIFATLAVK